MKKFATSNLQEQENVRAYFQSLPSWWRNIYKSKGVDAYSMEYEDESFDLVIANSAFPWLDRLEPAIRAAVKLLRGHPYEQPIACGAHHSSI